MFTLNKTTPIGRSGVIHTPHGDIQTPFFMPVGTAGAMKGLTHDDILDLGAQILLSNTYHLHLQPGDEVVAKGGGLHEYIHWKKPMLTDSGGFQVYSLRRTNKVKDEGVKFCSHLNGDELFMGPAESMQIQHNLNADMIMCFDECPASTASRNAIIRAVDRTLMWAQQCKDLNEKQKEKTGSAPLLFGIVQGGLHQDLRQKCAEELIAIGFDGYAIGGLAVGEAESEMLDVVDMVCPLLPEDKPRYLMGVGVIHQLQECVKRGIDMFDCVLPMRVARHGTILLSDGSSIRITNADFKEDFSLLDPDSPSNLSQVHSKSYLYHLMRAKERLGETIACKQNMAVTLKSMQDLRQSIERHT